MKSLFHNSLFLFSNKSDIQQPLELFEKSLAIVIQLGDKPKQAVRYWWIGIIYNKISK